MTDRRSRRDTAPRAPAAPPTPIPGGALAPRSTHVPAAPHESPVRADSIAPAHPADEQGYAIAVMSGAVRKGQWEPPAHLYTLAFWGGVELDFREADLLEGVTEVLILAVMGGVKVVVPPDIAVEVNGLGFMGGFGHLSQTAPEPDAPLLRIKGLAIMGGVEVKVMDIGEAEPES